MLRSLFLCALFFRKVVTDDTAAYRTDHRVMTCIVASDATYDSTLKAACRVCRPGGCEQECRRYQAKFASNFHVVCVSVMECNPSWRRVARFQALGSRLQNSAAPR
jgi:hypothetical protein